MIAVSAMKPRPALMFSVNMLTWEIDRNAPPIPAMMPLMMTHV